jgi:hypothetical protein
MGELNIFAARSGVVDGKVQNVGMAQRSANFLYFKYRFAARTMQVTARFNPYIACGFPGLIIDKYVDLETLRLHEKLKSTLPEGAGVPPSIPSMLGTHFLANFTDVSHQMDQSNGTTTLNCSYARQVEESVEFLGAKQEEVLTKQGNGPEATRTTKAAAIYPPHVGETGPGRGRIVSSVDVTKAYLVENFDSANKLPLLGGKRDKKTSQMATQVPVGISQKASNYGEEVVELVGDPNIIVAFKAFEITETMRPQRKETVYLPPEEYIRPGWYGTCWHPSKIAEVYYQFFGIGSITEATQISNNVPSDVSVAPVASSDALSTLEEAVAGGDVMKLARDQLLLLSQTKDASIQQSVALLVLTYSMLRYAGYDAEQFIRSYTWRPIATMPDMFGSSDLAFSSDGSQVERGFEGFHSRAFGQFEDLFGLVVPEIESIVGIHRGSVISKKVDTRKRKQQAVLDYVAVLKLSRGILG